MVNVTLVTNAGRQYPLVATIDFDHTHIADDGVAVLAVKLPTNAFLIGGSLVVKTAWDNGTSADLDVGDTEDPNRYSASPIDLTSASRTPLTLSGYVATTGLDIKIVPALVGSPATAGAARLEVEYLIMNRASEAQTN